MGNNFKCDFLGILTIENYASILCHKSLSILFHKLVAITTFLVKCSMTSVYC